VIALIVKELEESKKRINGLDNFFATNELAEREFREKAQRRSEEFEARLRELDSKINEIKEPVDALIAKYLPKKTTKPESSSEKKPEPSPAAAAPNNVRVASLKTVSATDATNHSAVEPPKPAAPDAPAPPKSSRPEAAPPAQPPAKPTSSIEGFFVVGTYPAVGGDLKAQRAWVSNGKNLIEVLVGSRIGGAVITGIEGETVITNQGSIKPKG